jgi:hypothetical protein
MKLKTIDYFIIILVLATAVLHFAAAFDRVLFPDGTPDPLFTSNGIGYLGLLGAYLIPDSFFQKNQKPITSVVAIVLIIFDWIIFNTVSGLSGTLSLLISLILAILFYQNFHKIQFHKVAWWTLFIYVIVTIAAWLAIWVGMNVIAQGVPFFGRDSIYGVPAKIIEIVLLYLLWQEKP